MKPFSGMLLSFVLLILGCLKGAEPEDAPKALKSVNSGNSDNQTPSHPPSHPKGPAYTSLPTGYLTVGHGKVTHTLPDPIIAMSPSPSENLKGPEPESSPKKLKSSNSGKSGNPKSPPSTSFAAGYLTVGHGKVTHTLPDSIIAMTSSPSENLKGPEPESSPKKLKSSNSGKSGNPKPPPSTSFAAGYLTVGHGKVTHTLPEHILLP